MPKGPKSNPAHDANIYAAVMALKHCGINGPVPITAQRFGIGIGAVKDAVKRHKHRMAGK